MASRSLYYFNKYFNFQARKAVLLKESSKRSDELSFHVPSHPMLTVVSPLTALKNYKINSCERLALKCCI